MITTTLHGVTGSFATVTTEAHGGKVSLVLLDESSHLHIGISLQPKDALALAAALTEAAQASITGKEGAQ